MLFEALITNVASLTNFSHVASLTNFFIPPILIHIMKPAEAKVTTTTVHVWSRVHSTFETQSGQSFKPHVA